MYTPRNADSPTTTTRRAWMDEYKIGPVVNLQAMIAANSIASEPAAAAISLRCDIPIDDLQKHSATDTTRKARSGVMDTEYHSRNHAAEYGWYRNSKTIEAAVAAAKTGRRLKYPDRIN